MYNKKVLSKAKAELNKAKAPKKPKDIVTDPMGQWKYPGQVTRIPSGNITMKGVNYPVLGVSDTGQQQMMYPGVDYIFPNAEYVDEYPQMRKGGSYKGKRKTKSISGTNKLFRENDLVKNHKNKEYDPDYLYFQDGGYKTKLSEDEEKEFQKFYTTLPENLQSDDPTYDIRGYWDSEGRPAAFNYEQPRQDDGYYHAYSINPNTGEYLKSPAHPTFQHAVEQDKAMGYTPSFNVRTGRWESVPTEPKQYNERIEPNQLIKPVEGPRNIQSSYDYDDAQFYLEDPQGYNAFINGTGHATDRYKLPTHPTFSKGSMYSNEETPGGDWFQNQDGSWKFKASSTNRKNMSKEALQNYFNEVEQGNELEYQDGGYIETELTPDEIEEYRKGGYIVEDISIPELTKAQKGIIEISDPKEFAYREKKYNDSLNLYNQGEQNNKLRTELEKKYKIIKGSGRSEFTQPDFMNDFKKNDIAPIKVINIAGASKQNGEKLFRIHRETNGFTLPIPDEDFNRLVKLDFIYKKPTQKPVLKSKKNKYPEGYQPYSLYGKVLDPEVYGYGESIHGKPVELAQGADMMFKKMQMEKYKKSGKYPWVKQDGGLIEAQKGGFKPIPLPLDKTKSETTQMVSLPARQAIQHIKNKPGADKAKQKEKKEIQKFKKELWKEYEKLPVSEKVFDRVGAFFVDPFGMTARALTGEQAYLPGMGKGLLNDENPEIRDKYLKELGYTKGEFDASDLQNIINPAYWASSFVDKVERGNYGDAAVEGILMGLPHLPQGTISRSNIKSGAKLLADDIFNKTPLKNTYKILGKDTKFYNLGEKPHWLKGYRESWNPMEADLEPLADFRFNKAIKNLENKKMFKEHDAVNNKYSQILNDLSEQKKIALDANNTKAVSEINAKLDDLFNARLKEHNKIARKHFQSNEHPFEEQIGAGGFGTVYGLPESEYVIKVGQIPKNENILKLVENAKGINKPNIALPKRASTTSSGENVIVMNKVEPIEGNIFTTPPTKESYEQLIKDVEELHNKGIYLDFENPQNIKYNPKTGLFNIYDLNTTGYVLHKTVPKNSYKASEKTIEQLLIDNKVLPIDWNKKASKQLSTLPNLNDKQIVKAGLDGNFLTRPLTFFTKNELLGTPDKKMLYRKIGNIKGLQDLIEKQGAQAPKPMRMTSGTTVNTPFFGAGVKPNENYGGLFAVEVDPSNPKYTWSNNVGGVSNYGVAPYNPETGELVKNIPLEDLNVYKKKWFSNNYKKLNPEELKAASMFAREQVLLENLYKWGIRGAVADQIFNNGDYRKKIQNYFLGNSKKNSKNFQKGGESLPVKELEPVIVTPVSMYQQEYKDANSYDDFYNQKVDDYLRKMPKGLGKMMGINSDRVPSNIIKKINDEYQYNMNNYVTDQILKNKKYDVNAREEWVDKLKPSEYEAFANSKYTGKLKPNLWTRSRAGIRALGNTLLPGQPISYNIKGLTPKEQQQYKDDSFAAFDALAFADLPGAWIGNYLADARDYSKNPDLLSGEMHANLAEGAESMLNPLAYIEGAAGVDMLSGAVKLFKNAKQARQARKLNKILEKLQPIDYDNLIPEYKPRRLSGFEDEANNVVNTVEQTPQLRPITDFTSNYLSRIDNMQDIFNQWAIANGINNERQMNSVYDNIMELARNHGMDRYTNLEQQVENLSPSNYNAFRKDLFNVLQRVSPESFDSYAGNVPTNSNSTLLRNKSGLDKDAILKKAKDSDKIKKQLDELTPEQFENSVYKPTGELTEYIPVDKLNKLKYIPDADWTGKMIHQDAVPLTRQEYVQIFNDNLDKLNELIEDYNTSGLQYRVTELTPQGSIKFTNPKQVYKKTATVEQLNEINKLQEEIKNVDNALEKGLYTSESDITKMISNKDYAEKRLKRIEKSLSDQEVREGKSAFVVDIIPGQWRGNVEDIANSDYYKYLPGLNMSNTTGSVFADRVARRGTGFYDALNEYLKKYDLGRVKPGFNSQTESSEGLWNNAISKGKAHGFYNNRNVLHGSFKKNGGIVAKLTKKEIDAYAKRGYIVEDVD